LRKKHGINEKPQVTLKTGDESPQEFTASRCTRDPKTAHLFRAMREGIIEVPIDVVLPDRSYGNPKKVYYTELAKVGFERLKTERIRITHDPPHDLLVSVWRAADTLFDR
jgi:hypothetical protein